MALRLGGGEDESRVRNQQASRRVDKRMSGRKHAESGGKSDTQPKASQKQKETCPRPHGSLCLPTRHVQLQHVCNGITLAIVCETINAFVSPVANLVVLSTARPALSTNDKLSPKLFTHVNMHTSRSQQYNTKQCMTYPRDPVGHKCAWIENERCPYL